MFFDERFQFVGEGSTSQRVSEEVRDDVDLSLLNNKAPKNGYAYIYVSNESYEPVYFDNLKVSHNRGRIIEEDHYYSFGLKIAAISSTKLGEALYEGHLENKNLYNDKELVDDADLDWYDYGFRMYDAQIGRFPQLDPLTWDYPELTNYQYASNDPIDNVDLDGLEGMLATVTVISHAKKAAQFGFSTLVGSYLKATSSFLLSATTGGPQFTNGVAKGVGQWAGDKLNSSVNNVKLQVAFVMNPAGTIKHVKQGLKAQYKSIKKEASKIVKGDFSSPIKALNKFANSSVEEHGEFAGKAGVELGIAAVTMGEGGVEEGAGEIMESVNAGKNAGKLTEGEVGEFLEGGENWHQTTAKKRFLKPFKKELRGEKNPDFYWDKNTKEVFLKTRQSGRMINTGKKFQK